MQIVFSDLVGKIKIKENWDLNKLTRTDPRSLQYDRHPRRSGAFRIIITPTRASEDHVLMKSCFLCPSRSVIKKCEVDLCLHVIKQRILHYMAKKTCNYDVVC